MHSRAASLSFEQYVLCAVHHWQKWSASSFSPWYFEHRALPRMSGTCIGVRDGCLLLVPRGPGEIAWPLILVEWGVRVGVDCRVCRTWPMGARMECFNDWGGRGYEDSVTGEVTETTLSGDRTTLSSPWSTNLP